MTASGSASPLPAFAEAIAAQQRLERALIGAGLDPSSDFPQMAAEVNRLGEPQIAVGAVTLETADRLGHAISGGTASRR